jgi:ribosome-binding factor A
MARKRPFQRTDRLASQIREVIATALTRDSREALLHAVVITDVDVTSDLSLARVYWHALPGAAERDRPGVEAAFARAGGFLRSRVAEVIRARKLPDLRFLHDDALDHGRRIDGILHQLAEDRVAAEPSSTVAASSGLPAPDLRRAPHPVGSDDAAPEP